MTRPIPEGVVPPVLGWCPNCGEILKMENKPSISPFGFFGALHCEVVRLNTDPTQISTSAVDPKDALIRELVGVIKRASGFTRGFSGPKTKRLNKEMEDVLTLARTTCPEAFE